MYLKLDTMTRMSEYEYQLDIRLDGKYYCRIYQHGIPGAITSTEDFDSKEEAIEVAEEIIRELLLKTDEA